MPAKLNNIALTNVIYSFGQAFMNNLRIWGFSGDPVPPGGEAGFFQPVTSYMPLVALDPSGLPNFIEELSPGGGPMPMPGGGIQFTNGPPGTIFNSSGFAWTNTTGNTVTITHLVVTPFYNTYEMAVCPMQNPVTVENNITVYFQEAQIVLSITNP